MKKIKTETKESTISNSGQAFRILIEKVYSSENVFKNIYRELVTNSIDARATKIKLETTVNSSSSSVSVSVSDNGTGMSREFLEKHYISFLNSMKFNDDTTVGKFGIGGKIILSVTDRYTITTVCNGEKTTAIFGFVDSDTPKLAVISCEKTDEENGTVVSFMVDDTSSSSYNIEVDSDTIVYGSLQGIRNGNTQFEIVNNGESRIVEPLEELTVWDRPDAQVKVTFYEYKDSFSSIETYKSVYCISEGQYTQIKYGKYPGIFSHSYIPVIRQVYTSGLGDIIAVIEHKENDKYFKLNVDRTEVNFPSEDLEDQVTKYNTVQTGVTFNNHPVLEQELENEDLNTRTISEKVLFSNQEIYEQYYYIVFADTPAPPYASFKRFPANVTIDRPVQRYYSNRKVKFDEDLLPSEGVLVFKPTRLSDYTEEVKNGNKYSIQFKGELLKSRGFEFLKLSAPVRPQRRVRQHFDINIDCGIWRHLDVLDTGLSFRRLKDIDEFNKDLRCLINVDSHTYNFAAPVRVYYDNRKGVKYIECEAGIKERMVDSVLEAIPCKTDELLASLFTQMVEFSTSEHVPDKYRKIVEAGSIMLNRINYKYDPDTLSEATMYIEEIKKALNEYTYLRDFPWDDFDSYPEELASRLTEVTKEYLKENMEEAAVEVPKLFDQAYNYLVDKGANFDV